MTTSVQSEIAAPGRFVVKLRAGMKAASRHQRELHNRDDACVLADEKAASLRANVSANVAAIQHLLKADALDVIFWFSACVHKPTVRLDSRSHDAPLTPQRQRSLAYTGSLTCHTKTFSSEPCRKVARAEYPYVQTKTCSSIADLSAPITFQSPRRNKIASAITPAARINPINSIIRGLSQTRHLGRHLVWRCRPIFISCGELADQALRNVSDRFKFQTRPMLMVLWTAAAAFLIRTLTGGVCLMRPQSAGRRPFHFQAVAMNATIAMFIVTAIAARQIIFNSISSV